MDWHQEMDRKKMREFIMENLLKRQGQDDDLNSLKNLAVQFEEKIFSVATDATDYRQRILKRLKKVGANVVPSIAGVRSNQIKTETGTERPIPLGGSTVCQPPQQQSRFPETAQRSASSGGFISQSASSNQPVRLTQKNDLRLGQGQGYSLPADPRAVPMNPILPSPNFLGQNVPDPIPFGKGCGMIDNLSIPDPIPISSDVHAQDGNPRHQGANSFMTSSKIVDQAGIERRDIVRGMQREHQQVLENFRKKSSTFMTKMKSRVHTSQSSGTIARQLEKLQQYISFATNTLDYMQKCAEGHIPSEHTLNGLRMTIRKILSANEMIEGAINKQMQRPGVQAQLVSDNPSGSTNTSGSGIRSTDIENRKYNGQQILSPQPTNISTTQLPLNSDQTIVFPLHTHATPNRAPGHPTAHVNLGTAQPSTNHILQNHCPQPGQQGSQPIINVVVNVNTGNMPPMSPLEQSHINNININFPNLQQDTDWMLFSPEELEGEALVHSKDIYSHEMDEKIFSNIFESEDYGFSASKSFPNTCKGTPSAIMLSKVKTEDSVNEAKVKIEPRQANVILDARKNEQEDTCFQNQIQTSLSPGIKTKQSFSSRIFPNSSETIVPKANRTNILSKRSLTEPNISPAYCNNQGGAVQVSSPGPVLKKYRLPASFLNPNAQFAFGFDNSPYLGKATKLAEMLSKKEDFKSLKFKTNAQGNLIFFDCDGLFTVHISFESHTVDGQGTVIGKPLSVSVVRNGGACNFAEEKVRTKLFQGPLVDRLFGMKRVVPQASDHYFQSLSNHAMQMLAQCVNLVPNISGLLMFCKWMQSYGKDIRSSCLDSPHHLLFDSSTQTLLPPFLRTPLPGCDLFVKEQAF